MLPRATRVALFAFLVVSILLGVASPGLAQGPVNPLDRMYERLRKAVQWQADYLAIADKLAARTREWIDDQSSKGKDTSELEEALQAFSAGLSEAKALHEEAVAVLDKGEGFDVDGLVVDRMKAFETMMKVARALGDAQRALWTGMMELRGSTGEWRHLHRPRRPHD
jgi:hypothetical protein